MATQNLLQRLDKAADTTGSSADASDRRIEEVFIAGAALSAGDFVSLDMTQVTDSDIALYVQKVDSADYLCPVGVVIADADAGANVRVCVRGVIEANVSGVSIAIAAGDSLFIGGTAGVGFAKTDADGTHVKPQMAVALEASTAAEAIKVYVCNNF